MKDIDLFFDVAYEFQWPSHRFAPSFKHLRIAFARPLSLVSAKWVALSVLEAFAHVCVYVRSHASFVEANQKKKSTDKKTIVTGARYFWRMDLPVVPIVGRAGPGMKNCTAGFFITRKFLFGSRIVLHSYVHAALAFSQLLRVLIHLQGSRSALFRRLSQKQKLPKVLFSSCTTEFRPFASF